MAERLLPPLYQRAVHLLPDATEVTVGDGVFIGHGVLPRLLVANLIDLSEDLGDRKHEYAWTTLSGLPNPIRETAIFFRDVFQLESDRGVLKRYNKPDPYISGAYQRHRDPRTYRRHRIALNGLDGTADSIIWTRKPWTRRSKAHKFQSSPNTTAICEGGLDHQVSPPLNSDGIRHFFFLGKTSQGLLQR